MADDSYPCEELLLPGFQFLARVFLENCDPDTDVPTTENQFVIMAEQAYFDALKLRR